MKRYLKLYYHFLKNDLVRELEFRANFIIWSVFNLGWFLILLATVYLIFGQVNTLAGWSRAEVLLLTVIYSLFESFLSVFILRNVFRFAEMVRMGELDFVLLKPVNSRFFLSTRYVKFEKVFSLIAYLLLTVKFYSDLNISLTIGNLGGFLVVFISGLLIFYSLFYILATSNIWFINLFNLEFLCGSVVDAGKFPSYIFQGTFRAIFFYLIPVVCIATFPTLALMGKLSLPYIVLSVLTAVVFFTVSQILWRFALKHYSSASS
jgi:ABC-2 type transport system permease protein